MASIFLSYKRNHAPSEALVHQLEEALGDSFELLRDQTMEPGAPWSKQLYQWLLDCDAGIAIVSAEANTADWCRREWSVLAARSQASGLPVFPIHVDGKIIETSILDENQAIEPSAAALARLRATLDKLPSRLPTANDFLALHQAWLRWQFTENPVLGKEPYALADVYIETECGALAWSEINDGKGKERQDPFKEASGGRADLLETVLQRIAEPKFRDLIVVQAGPGSGKSAFTLRLAHELMSQGFTPILIRFRDLRLATHSSVRDLLDDAIRFGQSEDDLVEPSPDHSLVEHVLGTTHSFRGLSLCRAVFILDGWDEVSLTGSLSYQAQLQAWLPKLREFLIKKSGKAVRLVLTGRPSSEVGHSGVLYNNTPILTMRPIRPDQLRGYAAAIETRLRLAGEAAPWAINLPHLEPIFVDYGRWFERFIGGQSDSDTSSVEVLGNPLLAYLSLRVIAESRQSPEELLREPTALYHELIEATVRHAGKGHDAELEDAAHRGGDKLRRLLHEVASTISIRRAEAVSFTELEQRFEEPGLPIPRDLLKGWTKTAATESALRELVVNFYFKGGHSALGCEFLHKSFREYLFAEAILYALDDSFDRPGKNATYDALEYWQDFAEGTPAHWLSRRLSYLLAPQWLTEEVERHLRWLLQRRILENPERWGTIRDLLAEVYAWWAEGVHLRHQPTGSRQVRWKPPFVDQLFVQTAPFDAPADDMPARSTTLDGHLGRALLQVTAFVHALAPSGMRPNSGRRAVYQSIDRDRLRFRPGRGSFLPALVARIDAAGWTPGAGLDLLVLDEVDLEREDLTLQFLGGTSLRGARLRLTRLSYAWLGHSDLSGADLEQADLTHAYLGSANFNKANLRGSFLTNAHAAGANLVYADLTGSNLVDSHLAGANLTGAVVSRRALESAKEFSEANGLPAYIKDSAPPSTEESES